MLFPFTSSRTRLHRDLGLKPAGRLDELRGGPRVQAQAVPDHHVAGHATVIHVVAFHLSAVSPR